ncbi:hypothetical protein COCSUDRAFT_65971 [Coccomyxa subellipsoidea C-169]|uniref:Uncharacterized protein n=1 Tax=Coccomyxa subellipsoidea (strain C-169) TaxID=574566 RepID=I0YYS4_COCSC|nr:hypothetical protein COCSUDRAFT_65971 [Coccomyxa subellipsoidea C-169]EIE23543.1 hypothetical protein COCSUDRAFT_65971 [Coccomyxa subellipsoidea C-169]|eukprot:XP_005648087.1 hypothetical protein COCSUDRAFT_65971 [Coccomyxa subellipsoidea C-169]
MSAGAAFYSRVVHPAQLGRATQLGCQCATPADVYSPGLSGRAAFLTEMANGSIPLFVVAILLSAAHLGAAHTSNSKQPGRHMLQFGFNGAAYARPANSRCLVGPGCGEDRNRDSSPTPVPTGRHLLSTVSNADISDAASIGSNENMGRQILQTGFNGAAFARPQRNPSDSSNPSPGNAGTGRHLLQELTGLN